MAGISEVAKKDKRVEAFRQAVTTLADELMNVATVLIDVHFYGGRPSDVARTRKAFRRLDRRAARAHAKWAAIDWFFRDGVVRYVVEKEIPPDSLRAVGILVASLFETTLELQQITGRRATR